MISNSPQTWQEMMHSFENNLILDKNLRDLPFSCRVSNVLDATNLKTVRNLVSKTPSELMEYRNLGKQALKEIIVFLAQYGLSLKGDSLP
jgi:DNA-directed RNA polymerase alpha subunit